MCLKITFETVACDTKYLNLEKLESFHNVQDGYPSSSVEFKKNDRLN